MICYAVTNRCVGNYATYNKIHYRIGRGFVGAGAPIIWLILNFPQNQLENEEHWAEGKGGGRDPQTLLWYIHTARNRVRVRDRDRIQWVPKYYANCTHCTGTGTGTGTGKLVNGFWTHFSVPNIDPGGVL